MLCSIIYVLSQTFQISIDVVGLVDEWAARFFEELDYVNEGENGTLFAEMMREDLPQVASCPFIPTLLILRIPF